MLPVINLVKIISVGGDFDFSIFSKKVIVYVFFKNTTFLFIFLVHRRCSAPGQWRGNQSEILVLCGKKYNGRLGCHNNKICRCHNIFYCNNGLWLPHLLS